MKKIIGLVVVLAALVLGSYYGTGLVTERTIKKNIDVINQSNGLFAEIEQYNRGWFTSNAVLNWRLHLPPRMSKDEAGQPITIPAKDYAIKMPLTIYHGPIIVANDGVKFGLGYAHTDITMPPAYDEKFTNLFTPESTKPQLSLNLFVNYLNNSRLHVGLPSFKLISKQNGDQFEWLGMDSHVSISSNLDNIDGGITIDGATLNKQQLKATLSKLTTDYDLHQTEAGLYLGNANLTLPSFVVTQNNQKIFDLETFDVQSSSDVNGDLFNTHFKTSLAKVFAHGKTYGPAVFEMSVKNLDAQVLAEINNKLNTIQQSAADTARQQALLALLPDLPRLFSKGAQFEVSKLSFVMPEGEMQGNLLVSLPKGDAGNPFQLIQKVQGHGKLKIPASVLKELMVTSAKQKLIAQQPTLQQAMAQQLSADPAAKTEVATETKTTVDPATTTKTTTVITTEQPKPLTVAEIEQQAITQVDQKLTTMTQTGLVTLQGNEYIIEVTLAQGQLSINGKPFNSAMLQF